jgi:hypothetical protein
MGQSWRISREIDGAGEAYISLVISGLETAGLVALLIRAML